MQHGSATEFRLARPRTLDPRETSAEPPQSPITPEFLANVRARTEEDLALFRSLGYEEKPPSPQESARVAHIQANLQAQRNRDNAEERVTMLRLLEPGGLADAIGQQESEAEAADFRKGIQFRVSTLEDMLGMPRSFPDAGAVAPVGFRRNV